MATLTVGPTGTYPSIAAAMAAALPGDTIQLEAGYQGETATITVENLTFTGNATNTGFTITLGAGIVEITWFPTGGGNTFLGNTGNNSIFASNGGNTIDGGLGFDVMNGGNGADRIISGVGNVAEVSVNGGGGQDTLVIDRSTATAPISVSSPFGPPVVTDVLGTWTYASIERIEFTGGSGDDVAAAAGILRGNGGNDILRLAQENSGPNLAYGGEGDDRLTGVGELFGEAGNDILTGEFGVLFLSGGDGNDTISTSATHASIDGGAGQDLATIFTDNGNHTISIANSSVLQTFAGGQTLVGIEQISLTLGSGNDTITGGDLMDTLLGNAGNDVLNGGGANDRLVGSTGNDVLDGGDGADELTGDSGGDILRGGAGDDILVQGYITLIDGPDHYDGGTGTDRIYLQPFSAVDETISLADPSVVQTLSNGSTFVNIEQIDIVSGLGNDRITGGALADGLNGGNGNDVLDGGLGADGLNGGAGDDTLISGIGNTVEAGMIGGDGIDTVIIDRTGGNSPLNWRAWFIQGVEIFRITGSEGNDVWTASLLDDVLIGNGGQDLLEGGGGNDLIEGGAGNDVLDGGLGVDTASYASNSAAVFVQLQLQGTVQHIGAAGSDTLRNFENLLGSAFDDVLFGDNVANTITGGAGNDTIEGFGGDDILDGGDGRDTVSYQNATGGNVAVSLLGAANGGAGNDTVLNFENIVGSVFNDVLFGNDVANELLGGSGNDTINGGLGNDILQGEAGNDTAAYTYAAVGVTVTLGAQGIAQNTTGAGLDTLTGFENLAGSGFNDVLIGDANVNLLAGGDGADILNGGGNGDILAGGAGADFFILSAAADSANAAPDIITDFLSGTDKLDLRAFARTGDGIAVSTSGVYTVVSIDVGNNGSIDSRVLLANNAAIATADILLAPAAEGWLIG